ncbi:MAG TPA: polysaccharide biosynthesis/export family protein [Gemmatimonadales bacterium]|nr:polysaccharide biosynthesis/export family protein [Gemmatimonadales bacterium]
MRTLFHRTGHTLIAGLLLLSLALQARDASSQEPAAGGALMPGDVLRITVWRQPELSGEFRILEDGAVGHPLYQSVNVRNLSLPALTTRVREFLSTYEQNPQFVLEPLLRVAVGGEVRIPNLYMLPVGTTVSQAVAQAGGATESGNLRKVRLLREGSTRMIDLTDARSTAAGTPIRSGDELLVGRRGNVLRDFIGPFASILGAAAAIVGATR